MDILGNVQRHGPYISVVLTVGINLGHENFTTVAFQLRVVHILAAGAVEVGAPDVHICICLAVGKNLVVIALSVAEGFRGHNRELQLAAVIGKEVNALVLRPPGPVKAPVRLVLDGDGIKVYAVALHVIVEIVQMLRIGAIGAFLQPLGVGVV